MKGKLDLNKRERALLNLYETEKRKELRRKDIYEKLRNKSVIYHDNELTRILDNLVEKKILGKKKKGSKEVYYELLFFENQEELLVKIRDQELLDSISEKEISHFPFDFSIYGLNLDFFPKEKLSGLTYLIGKTNENISALIRFITNEFNVQIKSLWNQLLVSELPEIHQWILWFIYTAFGQMRKIPMIYRETVCYVAKWLFNIDLEIEEFINEHIVWLNKFNKTITIIEETIGFYYKSKMVIYSELGFNFSYELPFEYKLKNLGRFYENMYGLNHVEVKEKELLTQGKSDLRRSSISEVNQIFLRENTDSELSISQLKVKSNKPFFDNDFDWLTLFSRRLTGLIGTDIPKILKEPKINRKSKIKSFDNSLDDLCSLIVSEIANYLGKCSKKEELVKELPHINDLIKINEKESEKERDSLWHSWYGARVYEVLYLKKTCGMIFLWDILNDLELIDEKQINLRKKALKEIKHMPQYVKTIGMVDPIIRLVLTKEKN